MSKQSKGFDEPNYTQTPNRLFDEIMREIDTMAEMKVTLAIVRQTVGWHRKRVRFGIGKIERLTGLARNSVVAGAEAAAARGTIRRLNEEGEACWELIINDTPSTAEGVENDGGDSIPEGTLPQGLTKKPSTAEGLKRKKEIKEPLGGLSEKEYEQANAKVTAMVEASKKVKYENRDKIPEPLLPFSDVYVEQTGQKPTKRVLMDWIATFHDWIGEGLQPEDIRAAYKHATRPDGGFLVGRPGSLTNTAVALKSKSQASKPQIDQQNIEATKQIVNDKFSGEFVPRPETVQPPAWVKDHVAQIAKRRSIRK